MLLHTSCHMEQGIGDDLSTLVALRVKAICLSAYSNNYLLSRKSAMHSPSTHSRHTTFTCAHGGERFGRHL